jgi:urease accessory protein
MIAASLLVTGLLVVSRLRVPGVVAALAVGVFAVFHGVAHGYELAGDDSAWQTLAGMLAATALLHGAGLAAGWALRHRQVWLARAAGAGVAAFGGALLLQMA